MGRPQKDTDIEVHGLELPKLYEVLQRFGQPITYGESFGIISFPGLDIDIALPRKERATGGGGHRDFDVDVDPFLGTENAARRRDFTINAMMEDVLTGEILDHFGGLNDLRSHVLRHVDDSSFPEDPLRVYRAAQFAARLGFKVHPDTVMLCSGIDTSTLSPERVEAELKKALLEGVRPSDFFSVLSDMRQLDAWFPEILMMKDIPQDPVFHPEGNVFVHSMQVLDRAASYRPNVKEPYPFMLLALLHDIGKIVSTEEIDGRIHAYGHEVLGDSLLNEFLNRLVSSNSVKKYVRNMVPLHMKPNVIAFNRASVKTTNHMFDDAVDPEGLIYMAMSDRPVFSGDVPFNGDCDFLFERLNLYREIMSKPGVTGKDLIEAGIQPSQDFTEILSYAHKLHLADIPKESALKQCISYARKLRGKDNACK